MAATLAGILMSPATDQEVEMSISFDTPEAIEWFRYTVVASGAALYINTGMRPNRMYTPTRMRDVLNEATGSKAKNLKAALTDYVKAAADAGFPVRNVTVLEAVGLVGVHPYDGRI